MNKGVTQNTVTPLAAPGNQVDYSSVSKMNQAEKIKFLKQPDFNPSQLKDPYDQLNAQMYRWTQIAENVQKGSYSDEDKSKIASAAYDRMIRPYYERTKDREPLSKELWMKEAYGMGAHFDLNRSYTGSLYNGGSHGVMSLMQDAIQASKSFVNILGAFVSPPKPITDESWQAQQAAAKNHTAKTGFWDQVQEAAESQSIGLVTIKDINKALNSNSEKVEFLQKLRPNKDFVAGATSLTMEAVPWVAATALTDGTSLLPEAGSLEAWIGASKAGRIASGALQAARDGFVYGTLTRKQEDKGKALEDAIDWAIGSTVLHVAGESLMYIGGKVINVGKAGADQALERFKNKGKLLEAGRRNATPAEATEESEAGVAETVAKYGTVGQRAVDNHAAEYLMRLSQEKLSDEEIKAKELHMLNNGTPQDRIFLDSVTRLREALGEQKLEGLDTEQKANLLARLQALTVSSSGQMTKYIVTLQESLRQRFTSMPPDKLDKNVMSYLMSQIASKLPSGSPPQIIAKAAQAHWADLVVQAGIEAEEKLAANPFGEAQLIQSTKKASERASRAKIAQVEGALASTRRWTNKKGESGVSYSYSPAWKVYAQNAVGKGKKWTSEDLQEWVNDLDEDDFAADIHAYFLPEFMKQSGIHFESSRVASGRDHSNLYAFAWNFKDSMPKEYSKRLEEEYLNSPKMSQFYSQTKSEQEKTALARTIALSMWNHVDNFLGSGRWPKESNIFRSTQSDLNNPTVWQKELFQEREQQETGIIKKMYKDGSSESQAALSALKILFGQRREAYKAGEQVKMRLSSRMIADKLIDDSKGKLDDWGLR